MSLGSIHVSFMVESDNETSFFSEYFDFTLPVSFHQCFTLIPLSLNRFPEHREIQARSDKANAHKVASCLCSVNIRNVPVCVLYLIYSRSVRVLMFYVEQGVFICNKLEKYVSWGKEM